MKLRHPIFAAVLIALALHAGGCSRGERPASPDDLTRARREIAAQEDAFRAAKLKNDLPALERLLAADYVGINHNGHVRNKAQALELFRTFHVKALEVKPERVEVGSGVAIVTGSQSEHTCSEDDLLFLRVYVQRAGRWQLVSNSQFRRPPPSATTVVQK